MIRLRSIVLGCVLVGIVPACDNLFGKKPPPVEEPPPPPVASTSRVPPTILGATPLGEFADAAVDPEGKTPLEQARVYESRGQVWLARLVLEKTATASTASREEIEFLGFLCHQQGDMTCVDECGARLGKKLKFDGGVRRGPDAPGVHSEPDTDLARARNHVLKGDADSARKILEPKLLDGKASKEEIRLLKTVCEEQRDRLCVVLCDTKLK